MIETYTIGGFGASANTYGERLTRDRRFTPAAMRRIGIWAELPYTRSTESFINPRVRSVKVSNGLSPVNTFAATHGPLLSLYNASSPPNEADVISKLAERWRGTDLNIGLYLSPEGRESASMVVDGLKRLTNAALHLKRGDFGGFVRNLNHLPRRDRRRSARKFNQGDLSGSFLAAHLGWEPIIKDVYSASQGILPKDRPHRISATKAGVPSYYYLTNPKNATNFIHKEKLTVKIMGDITNAPSLTQALGMDNPFLIAWELVPLSFVADYFLPIGSIIDSMGFISAARFSKLVKKTYHDRWGRFTLPAGFVWNNGGTLYKTTNSVTVYRHRRDYSREPYSLDFSSPLQSMKLTLPTSLTRIATMSALLHQRLLALRK